MINCPEPYRGQVFTIIVTNDCNLRCKYCYEVAKCNKGTIPLEYVDLFTKMLINGTFDIGMDSYEFDLLGGDALMYPELCGQIIDTIVKRLVLSDFKNRNRIKFSICSNGTLFERKDVREFLIRYKPLLSLGVSIDGSPKLHDLNRIYADGKGSMEKILKWWPWFKDNFPEDSLFTKATLAKSSIPYISESLAFMHEELGLKYIHQNFIMEDAGLTNKDISEFNHQMELCSKYVFDHRDNLYWSMLDRVYTKRKEKDKDIPNISRCGSGVMPTMDIDGNIYACPRWCPFALGTETIVLGNVKNQTYDKEKADMIHEKSKRATITKDKKCHSCPYEAQCAYCPAGCYGEFNDFIRTTHICPITKIQSTWAENYWRRVNEVDG